MEHPENSDDKLGNTINELHVTYELEGTRPSSTSDLGDALREAGRKRSRKRGIEKDELEGGRKG